MANVSPLRRALLTGIAALWAVAPARAAGPATRPYLGWSSWTLEATTRAGYGGTRWLTDAHVAEQAAAMRRLLGPHGYSYVNLDSGWARGFDPAGCPTPDPAKFPNGLAGLAAHLHAHGQKLGLYVNPGVPDALWRQDPLVPGTAAHVRDICFSPRRPATAWRTNYRIDFSRPAAQAYVDSVAAAFARWGVDLVKLDGVTPGSDVEDPAPDDPALDARPDVAAWSTALARSGRPVWLTVSWKLDRRAAPFWRAHAQAWRIEDDVEQYGPQLASWDSARKRFAAAADWAPEAGPGRGWNDLDSLDVGNGDMDGLTADQRRTVVTLWAVACSPLYAGDDLTKLDSLGLDLLTNDEVIAVDQLGRPAVPVARGRHQVWHADRGDGSVTVALFNLGKVTAPVTAHWADVGVTGPAAVRDLWSHADLGSFDDAFTATLPVDACRLLRVTPGPSTAGK